MTKNVLFEIGLEELPARFIDDAEKQLREKTQEWLKELRISSASVTSFSTPRRLAVLIEQIAEEQTTIEEEAKGPALKIAQDAEGNWTKAAIGFTKGQGKTTEDIYTKEIKGIRYIFVKKYIEGKSTIDLLPSFREIIESIQFGNNMRWGNETLRYARPIRWLVALHGEQVIPFEIAHVKTNNVTYGHRFLGKTIYLQKPEEYVKKLRESFVIANPKKREQMIADGIKVIAKEQAFYVSDDPKLLNEVTNLVEFPTVFTGSFDETFLQLPSDVLVTSMKEHQRYFPVKTEKGELLPAFIGVRNGNDYKLDTVVKGNEKVLHARLSDAQFFYEEDRKQSIDFFQKKLQRVVFQEKLGTIADKVSRVVHISKQIGLLLEVDDETLAQSERIASICKFDLTTNMVNEFTELQGIMGETYARYFGEHNTVASGVREHYLPAGANGELPQTAAGSIVSVADKLDTIVGCIAVGLIPTGSHDPYGLRRQATGILRIMRDNTWPVALEDLLNITQSLYKTLNIEQEDMEKTAYELHHFFQLRATYLLKETGVEQDVIQAVLHKEVGIFRYTVAKAGILSKKRNDEQFKIVQEALVRILNLAKKTEQTVINPDTFVTDSEKILYERYQKVYAAYKQADMKLEAEEAMAQLGELADPIHTFFEHNMVMAEDEQLRNNRLALVNRIALLINDFADLSEIQWKQQY